MIFDESKPYGTIFGATSDGARYEQNGIRFTVSGNAIGLPAEKVSEPEEMIEPKEVENVDPVVDKEALRIQAHTLFDEGKSIGEIAKLLGVHHMKIRSLLA